METKLITKTIKELADEFDGNVEQLHRTISRCNEAIIDQKKEIDDLKYQLWLQKLARKQADKIADRSIFVMICATIAFFVSSAFNILFVW
jgi:uncharacterized coiled-coil DUF342 family protein